MLRITRRKKTDEGVLIPEWARRGWVSLSQFGLDGPVVSRIDFRVDPHDELVEVAFTGPTEEGEWLQEVECGRFPIADGLLPLLRLDTAAGGPLFDSMRLGEHRSRKLAEKGLDFSADFADHEARFIRFIWGLPRGPHRVAMSLPTAWWLHWFEHAPDLTWPAFERTATVGSLGSPLSRESIRTMLLDANPESDAIEWLRTVDLGTLDDAATDAAVPTPTTPRPRWDFGSIGTRLERTERVVERRLEGLRRYRSILDELPPRLEGIRNGMRSSAATSIDADAMFLGVNFLPPEVEVPGRATRVLDWARTFAHDPPTWWRMKRDTIADATDDPLAARLTGYAGLGDTAMLASDSPLAAIARWTWGDFGRAALPWILGPSPDAEVRRLVDGGGEGQAACRIAHGVAMVVGHRAHRESRRWQGPSGDWAPLADLAALFPPEITLADGPTVEGERFPLHARLRAELGVAEDASVATAIEGTDVVRDVFETCMRPLGIAIEEIQASQVLEYVLLWESWRERFVEQGGGHDA